MILSIPILSLGVIIATFCDVFLNFKNHSSLKTSAPPAQMKNEFTILSNNTCLMPEALARVNNLPFAVKRLFLEKKNILKPSYCQIDLGV